MTALREGANLALQAVACGLAVLAMLDLATLWMASVYLPVTAMWLQAAAFWMVMAVGCGAAALGLWRQRAWGGLLALGLFAVMIVLQQNEWQVWSGRSPYRARFAWVGALVVIGAGVLSRVPTGEAPPR